MTFRECELLRFITRYAAEHDGVGPSFEEMATATGSASKSGIYRLVNSLTQQGRLRRTGRTRGYEAVGVAVDLSSVTDADLLTEVRRRQLVAA